MHYDRAGAARCPPCLEKPVAENARRLPLFPLNSVLFPGMPLPLHIFEERYKLMIGTCLVTDRTFGVALIQHGQEVGAPAVPFEIGTTARIVDVERLPDGRMNLVAVGVERFQIRKLVEKEPFLVGYIRLLPTPDEPAVPELAALVAERFRAYARDLSGGEASPGASGLSDDPERLSYQLAAALRISPSVRQELLELDSPAERLRRLGGIIRREHDTLRLLAAAGPGTSIGPFSAN